MPARKTAIVTGSATGVGAATVLALAQRGYDVLVNYSKSETEAKAAGEACRAAGADVLLKRGDVSDDADCRALAAAAMERWGRLDVLVNNAGIVKDAMLLKVKDGAVVGKMGLDQWQAVLNVNLTGVFLCAREAAERMVKLGHGGVIINISSISRHGNVGQTNYTAAKAGVAAMTVTWAKELARYGIRVGSIAPGFTRTDILSSMKPEVLEKVVAPVPLQRLGEPEEIAHAAQFIVENDFFTGRCIDLDGGLRL